MLMSDNTFVGEMPLLEDVSSSNGFSVIFELVAIYGSDTGQYFSAKLEIFFFKFYEFKTILRSKRQSCECHARILQF